MSSLVSAASSSAENSQSWLRRHSQRMKEIGTGHLIYATTGWVLDNVVYVYAVCVLGLLKGGLIMTVMATAYCAVMLLFYQRMKVDWVGAGSIDEIASGAGSAWWQRIIRWAHRKGGKVIFIVLSVFQDAFITTAYFRRGRFGELNARDWQIFFGSAVISNIYWTLRSGAVGAIIITGWRSLTSP